ncbi:MAG: hypothetical protein RJA18_1693 [Pseudomonadota bacterium]
MGYNTGAIELGRMNLEKGKVDIAFEILPLISSLI